MLNNLFNLFRKDKPLAEPEIDSSFGYHRLAEFKTYLSKSQYSLFETAYEKLEWDAKTLLNEGIGLNESCAGIVTKWVAQQPNSYIAQLFAGITKTRLAWIARTAVAGAAVKEKNAQQFVQLLEEAYNHLSNADKINPEDAEICARMIRVCMGLGVEKEIVYGYFNAAIDLQPNHLMAHLMMINYLSPKWFGSIEEMKNFAQQQFEAAGSSLLVTLKLFDIVEEWIYYGMMGEKQKAKEIFANDFLKTQVLNWYSEYNEEQDGKLLIPYVYNYFAFVLYMFKEKELANKLVDKINGNITIYPWAYLDVTNYVQLQKTLL